VNIRFYIDPTTDEPHIYGHNIVEEEVEDILRDPGLQYAGREGTRIAVGQTQDGRYLRIIYRLDLEFDSVFVITAYELRGKALATYRRRKRRK
jgi:hypothetical protein